LPQSEMLLYGQQAKNTKAGMPCSALGKLNTHIGKACEGRKFATIAAPWIKFSN